MTAEPAGTVMWTPDPIRQRLADHTLEDVLALPDDAPRVEFRDGVMIVYDRVEGRYELAADADTQLLLSAPSDIELALRDIAP